MRNVFTSMLLGSEGLGGGGGGGWAGGGPPPPPPPDPGARGWPVGWLRWGAAALCRGGGAAAAGAAAGRGVAAALAHGAGAGGGGAGRRARGRGPLVARGGGTGSGVNAKVVADVERRKSLLARLLDGLGEAGPAGAAGVHGFPPLIEDLGPDREALRGLIRSALWERGAWQRRHRRPRGLARAREPHRRAARPDHRLTRDTGPATRRSAGVGAKEAEQQIARGTPTAPTTSSASTASRPSFRRTTTSCSTPTASRPRTPPP